jgi:glycine/D-amino acid oxidase-like deaminating enzyme
MPHAGRLDGAFYAGGYCGHGVAMSIYLGDRLGQHLASHVPLPQIAALDFPIIPLYNGQPWFLPLAGGWYRLKDWMS